VTGTRLDQAHIAADLRGCWLDTGLALVHPYLDTLRAAGVCVGLPS
jgi:hypothetical protein